MRARSAGALLLLAAAVPADAALNCAVSMVSPIDFGVPSPLTTSPVDVSSTFVLDCTAAKADIVGPPGSTRVANVCISYNNGSGGPSAGGNRQLLNGAEVALFDVYPSAAYGPTHWGSRTGAPTGTVVQLQLTLTKPVGPGGPGVTTNVTSYARLFGGQTTVPPGTYSSTLTVTAESFWNDVKSDCGPGGTVESLEQRPQLVTVTYQPECRVGTISTLDFGGTGFLTSAIDATTSVSVTCSTNTAYVVGLDAGTGAGATTANRLLTRTAAPFTTVQYGLYRDAARTQNWGNDTVGGTDTPSGIGTGAAVGYTVFGRVPPQITPETGDYLDTVVLTVVF